VIIRISNLLDSMNTSEVCTLHKNKKAFSEKISTKTFYSFYKKYLINLECTYVPVSIVWGQTLYEYLTIQLIITSNAITVKFS
jgi:hypothetical protein